MTNSVLRIRMGVDSRIIRKVLARDRGVCQQCGVDMLLIEHLYRLLETDEARAAVRSYWRVSESRDWGRWWTIDHIRPLTRGGDSSMVNLQTLCVPCHVEKEQTDLTAHTWSVEEEESASAGVST